MYDTFCCNCYWPHNAKDVKDLVKSCSKWHKMPGNYWHQRHLKLFRANWPLEFVRMDILVPLPKTSTWNKFAIIMTDRYLKQTRGIPVSKTTSLHASLASIDDCIMHQNIPNVLLANDVLQFVSKFYNSVCMQLLRWTPIDSNSVSPGN